MSRCSPASPNGWINAGTVWRYSAVFFLIQDRVKFSAARTFCEEHSGDFWHYARGAATVQH
jgi:hypothetical protein